MLNIGGWGGWALRKGRSCRAAVLTCLNRKPADRDGAAVGSYCSRGTGGVPGVGYVTLGGAGGTVTVMGDELDGRRSVTEGARGVLPHHLLFQEVCENEEDVYGVKKWKYLSLYHDFYKDFTFISFFEILVWLITIEFFSLHSHQMKDRNVQNSHHFHHVYLHCILWYSLWYRRCYLSVISCTGKSLKVDPAFFYICLIWNVQ